MLSMVNNNNSAMPLIISSSGTSSPTITVVEKGNRYRVLAGGDSAYVVMNGYKGNIMIEKSSYSPKAPTIIYEDGTQEIANYQTYQAKGISALKVYIAVNYAVDYYITFN